MTRTPDSNRSAASRDRSITGAMWAAAALLAAAAAVPAVAAADPLSTPSMTAPLSANANPLSVDAGPLGKIYISGAVTGLALFQDNAVPGDHTAWGDLSNGQVFVQKTDGPVQFFVEAGAYSLPSLGASYLRSTDINKDTYGPVPVGYLKFAPNSAFSIEVGKLPTLIGSEYTFTFQNMNIDRGLLWNQETAISRGVQANYAKGPLTVSLSWNDGFYSNKYNWVSGLLSYAVTPKDTLAVAGGGNLGKTDKSAFATPYLQNNGSIINLMYSHTEGAWLFAPYFQYTDVPRNAELGIDKGAHTVGGAILAKYSFTPKFSVAGRAEYISSSGSQTDGTPSLLYGPGSKAWSLTLTPTYQFKVFYIRGELAYTKADDATPGYVFGSNFDTRSQTRGAIETGVLF